MSRKTNQLVLVLTVTGKWRRVLQAEYAGLGLENDSGDERRGHERQTTTNEWNQPKNGQDAGVETSKRASAGPRCRENEVV